MIRGKVAGRQKEHEKSTTSLRDSQSQLESIEAKCGTQWELLKASGQCLPKDFCHLIPDDIGKNEE